MNPSRRLQIILLTIVLFVFKSQAQILVVDVSGPHNLFNGNPGSSSLPIGGVTFTPNLISTPTSPAASIEATTFTTFSVPPPPSDKTTPFQHELYNIGDSIRSFLLEHTPSFGSPEGQTVFSGGLDLKFTAENGLSDLRGFPQTDLSILLNGNYLIPRKIPGTSGSATFFSNTLRYTPSYGQDPIFLKTLPVYVRYAVKDEFTHTILDTLSFAPEVDPNKASPFSMDCLSMAFTFGYSATNNYTKLPKVTAGAVYTTLGGLTVVGSSKTARSGNIEHSNAFPLTLIVPYTYPYRGGTALLPIISPYITTAPADRGTPGTLVGVNLSLELVTPSSATGQPAKANIPISFFVERGDILNGAPSWTVGTGMMLKFP